MTAGSTAAIGSGAVGLGLGSASAADSASRLGHWLKHRQFKNRWRWQSDVPDRFHGRLTLPVGGRFASERGTSERGPSDRGRARHTHHPALIPAGRWHGNTFLLAFARGGVCDEWIGPKSADDIQRPSSRQTGSPDAVITLSILPRFGLAAKEKHWPSLIYVCLSPPRAGPKTLPSGHGGSIL